MKKLSIDYFIIFFYHLFLMPINIYFQNSLLLVDTPSVNFANPKTFKKTIMYTFSFSIVFLLLSVDGCKSSPTEVINTDNYYMSLNVGDIRQYSMPYSTVNTIHTVWKITGKTFRSDSTEVFISEWYTSNYYPQNRRIEYNFIRNGFFYSTGLDSSSNTENPFFEQKLAEIKPHDGDTWLQIAGYINPDSTQDSLTAKHLGEFDTPAGKFQDVYSFVLPNSITIYYAKQFGHLGISIGDDKSSMLLVNYIKINGREIGNYVKMDSLSSNGNYIYRNNKNFINPTGSKQR